MALVVRTLTEFDKVSAVSDMVTELTRKGEPVPITKAIHCIAKHRQQNILRQVEVAVMNEVSKMDNNEHKQFMDDMKRPPLWCFIHTNTFQHRKILAMYPSIDTAIESVYKWLIQNECVLVEHTDGHYGLWTFDDMIMSFDGYLSPTLEHCRDIALHGKKLQSITGQKFWLEKQCYGETLPSLTSIVAQHRLRFDQLVHELSSDILLTSQPVEVQPVEAQTNATVTTLQELHNVD